MRTSKTRETILKLLQSGLMTAPELVDKIGVNKTTIYRELPKLVLGGSVVEVDFGDGKKRYELTKNAHHHHIVCKICKVVKEVKINEDKLMPKIKDFLILNHSLEFFGLCGGCRQ